jgi:hypothetical protein
VGQLSDENLGIGDDTLVLIAELENELDIKPFFTTFYVATIRKMPLFSRIWELSTCSYDFITVKTLAKRFSQLGLAESSSLNKLREEFMDFCLSESDHPTKIQRS